MTEWALLAPGESASRQLADSLRDVYPVGVLTSAYSLAPWADFLAATDAAWWRAYPDAKEFAGRRFCAWAIAGVEKVRSHHVSTNTSSGVLALECAKRMGATRVRLYGFDHRGTHFFGQYQNGLSNTTPERREIHAKQFKAWAIANKGIEVINFTPGSSLKVFPCAA